MMFRRCGGLLAGAALAVLGACGDASGPVTVKQLQVTAGNNQKGPAGGELALPLSATVIGSNDRPLADVLVAWQVMTGSASVAPRAPRSDANGVVEAVVTLGAGVGPVEIQAIASAAPPAAFHATAVSPCTYAPVHTFGGSSAGRLRPGDCAFSDGSFVDWYSLTVPSAQAVRITMASDSVDAWLGLFLVSGGSRAFTAFNDDAGPDGTDAALTMLLTAGNFEIAASSFEPRETGTYTVTSAATSSENSCEAATGSGPVFPSFWVMRGVVTTQQLQGTTDCTDLSGQRYGDLFLLVLDAGEGVSLMQESTAFEPHLLLYGADGSLIADAGPGPDGTARLSHTATVLSVFAIVASSDAPFAQGAYRLTVATPPAVTQSRSAVAARRTHTAARQWRFPVMRLKR